MTGTFKPLGEVAGALCASLAERRAPSIKKYRRQSFAIEAGREVLNQWGMRIDREDEDKFLRDLQRALTSKGPKK